jgi:hypothetical protein
MRASRLLLALGLAALAAGCSKYKVAEPPPQDPEYKFPHEAHQDDVECVACHAPVLASTSVQQDKKLVAMPKKMLEVCTNCHDADFDKLLAGYQVPTRAREARVRMNHKDHLTRVKNCRDCHKQLPSTGATTPYPPPMASCTSCHNHQQDFAQARCTPCHVDLKGYVPQGAFAHAGDWLQQHGKEARPSAATCASCHDQTYCTKCHAPQTTAARPSILFPESVDRQFIHRGDYVSRHTIEANANPASCLRCHGTPFCDACHTQQNLRAVIGGNSRYPHPDPAAWMTRGSADFHGDAARRNVAACAACHEQGAQTRCLLCHSQGGANPHPSSWKSKYDLDDIRDNAMCRSCHTNG